MPTEANNFIQFWLLAIILQHYEAYSAKKSKKKTSHRVHPSVRHPYIFNNSRYVFDKE